MFRFLAVILSWEMCPAYAWASRLLGPSGATTKGLHGTAVHAITCKLIEGQVQLLQLAESSQLLGNRSCAQEIQREKTIGDILGTCVLPIVAGSSFYNFMTTIFSMFLCLCISVRRVDTLFDRYLRPRKDS